MKKKLVIAGSTLLALVALAGALAWYYMGKPMYEPGQVASGKNLRASLTPPAQSRDGSEWIVERGVTLHHYAHGTGRKVLVVHGGPGKPIQSPWPGLEALSSEYAFLYYDQRGCGLSTRPIDRFSSANYYGNMQVLEKTLGLGAQIADIERIRKILGEEKLVLLGHSFGAFLASLYAAEFPDRVSALVLVAPASVLVMPDEDGGLFGKAGRLLPEEMKQEYARYLKSYLDFSNIFSRTEAELASLNAGFGKYYRIAARAKGFSVPDEDQTNAQGGWMVQAMYFSMGKRHDYRSALKKTPAPVLVIHGENDIQPERASRAYSGAFPNATFRPIKRAGHFAFLDQPAEFTMAVGGFLKGVK